MSQDPVIIEGSTLQVVDVSALESITRGEVDMQVATAKRFPRSLSKFKKDALSQATVDKETAASCRYVIVKGGQSIEGASIRLAEIAAVAWGNLRIATRITDEGSEYITAEGVCWDMEKNVHIGVTERRRITTKSGKRYGADMIQTTGKAAATIARRNAILAVIPRAHINTILAECVKVGAGDAKTLGARVAQWLDWLKGRGVDRAAVLTYFEAKATEDLGLDELATIQGLIQGAKETDTSLVDVFKSGVVPEPPRGRQRSKGKAKPGGEKATEKATETQEAPPPREELPVAAETQPPSPVVPEGELF